MEVPYKRLANHDLYVVAGNAAATKRGRFVEVHKDTFDQMIEQLKRANRLRLKLCRKDQLATLGQTARLELEEYMEGEDIGNDPAALG